MKARDYLAGPGFQDNNCSLSDGLFIPLIKPKRRSGEEVRRCGMDDYISPLLPLDLMM